MLTKFRLIRNVGKYESCSGAPAMKQLTLIYSENARGKTTLTSILRSLGASDPSAIMNRRRLGTDNHPEIRIDTTSQNYFFNNDSWNAAHHNLVVFDDAFIEANVHSGLVVDREQRANLHEVVLGSQSVSLVREFEQVGSDINAVNQGIRDATEALLPHAYGMDIDQFISLDEVADVEEQIQAQEALLNQIQQAAPIQQQARFADVAITEVADESVGAILSRSLDNVEQAAISQVEAHFTGLGQIGEQWVRTGLQLSEHRTSCPFCDQDIQSNFLLASYRGFFSQQYEEHTQALSQQIRAIEAQLQNSLQAVRQSITTTDTKRTFWSQYINDLPNAPATDSIVTALEELQQQLQHAFQQKQQSPLTAIAVSQPLADALAAFTTARTEYLQARAALTARNADIQTIKDGAQAGDRQAVETRIANLKATRSRHSDEVRQLVETLETHKTRKNGLEMIRNQKRQQLDRQRQAVFPQFQTSVNDYLRRFGADFQIVNVSSDNRGNRPTVTYGLKINNTDISVDAFKHTLSAGDRSTLALAYFFSMLDGLPNLQDTVVVLDDPFTSMDKSRAHSTVQELRHLRIRCRQLIVLSHDALFLWKIQEQLTPQQKQDDLACIEITMDSGWTKSTLTGWDISEEGVTLYDRNHAALRDFSERAAGSLSEIARLLRDVMEGFSRVAFAEHYQPGKLLGEFRRDEMQRCKQNDGLLDDSAFRELCDITDYANKFHHATNPNYETELQSVDANALRVYVNRVLEFTKY